MIIRLVSNVEGLNNESEVKTRKKPKTNRNGGKDANKENDAIAINRFNFISSFNCASLTHIDSFIEWLLLFYMKENRIGNKKYVTNLTSL
jgi:hypothetical protein